MVDAVHADDVAEVPVMAGLNPGGGVLEDHGMRGLHAERLGARQERVRMGLSAQVLLIGDLAVDPRVEQVRDPGGLEHVLAVRAGRDDGARAGRHPVRP